MSNSPTMHDAEEAFSITKNQIDRFLKLVDTDQTLAREYAEDELKLSAERAEDLAEWFGRNYRGSV